MIIFNYEKIYYLQSVAHWSKALDLNFGDPGSNHALANDFQTYTLEQGISAQLLIPQHALGQRGELGPPFQRMVALRPSSCSGAIVAWNLFLLYLFQ